MTDPAIIAASYAAERNYSHNPDDVINASDAFLAIGTKKKSTTELLDLSLNGNDATIHRAMPTEGFIQGRRFGGVGDYLSTPKFIFTQGTTIESIVKFNSFSSYPHLFAFDSGTGATYCRINSDGTYVMMQNVADDDEVKLYYNFSINTIYHIKLVWKVGNVVDLYVNGVLEDSGSFIGESWFTTLYGERYLDGCAYYTAEYNIIKLNNFNTLAKLPFWSISYTDYPNNATEYTDNLPYSSSIISSGTFKVDDDKLQCVSAGTMTYSASYEFDGSEYIKVEIDGVEYAGTGTITQGNTTVSVAQGSNKVTIQMGTGDTIEGGIDIQFREEV